MVEGEGVQRPKLAGFSKPSVGISEYFLCCGLVDGVLLKSDVARHKLRVAVESTEWEVGSGVCSVSFGGVISTRTSTTSPAIDDDRLLD